MMSSRPSPQDVLNALRSVEDPVTRRDIVSLGFVKDVEVGSDRISFTIQFPAQPVAQQTRLGEAARKAVEALGIADVRVQMTIPPPPERGAALIPDVKHTIAVASGKGGVGKSTVAANLAVALRRQGARVGLMDTDVYGPSIPALFGGKEPPQIVEGKLEPPVEYGVKIISMAYFLPKDEAVVWRGPMLHKTIQQFLRDVRWGELDYLVMDLPPGTGDIQLSLSQTIPLTGAVIVSTPQDLALSVAWKAIAMFRKMKVPILGIIENMSYYVCTHCGYREHIFGHGGARRAAQELGFPFLGEIPLDSAIRRQSDSGKPVALGDVGSSEEHAAAYQSIAGALCEQVELAKARAGSVIIE
jgi:ATP-binding protein involved in chromosome partitioning